MQLLPIDIDDSLNGGYANDPECLDILKIYADYYKKIGYQKPWIGYFFSLDGKKLPAVVDIKESLRKVKLKLPMALLNLMKGRELALKSAGNWCY